MNNKTKFGLLLSALALCGAVSFSAVYANDSVASTPAATALENSDGVKAPDSEVLAKKKPKKK